MARRCLPLCKPALCLSGDLLPAGADGTARLLPAGEEPGGGWEQGGLSEGAGRGGIFQAGQWPAEGDCLCLPPCLHACCACSLHTHTPPRICMLSLAARAWRPWKLPERMQASSGAHSARESRPNQSGAPKTPDDEEQHSKVTTRAEWERIVQQAPPYDDVPDHAPIDWSLPDDEIPAGEASISDGLCSVTRHVTGLGREAECDKRVLLSAARRRGCP